MLLAQPRSLARSMRKDAFFPVWLIRKQSMLTAFLLKKKYGYITVKAQQMTKLIYGNIILTGYIHNLDSRNEGV